MASPVSDLREWIALLEREGELVRVTAEVDPAPFITLPAVITRDPKTGVRNVGMYRMQKIDRRSTFMHWQIHKDGRADLLASPDGTIPVAVALGLDPVTAYSASAPLPKHIG